MNERTATYLDRFFGGLLTLSAAGHTLSERWPDANDVALSIREDNGGKRLPIYSE